MTPHRPLHPVAQAFPRAIPAGIARAGLLAGLVFCAGTALAQHTVLQSENVRYDYAQVLRVTPVYQTLTATRTEQRCEPGDPSRDDSRLSRAVGAIRGALRRNDRAETEEGPPEVDCEAVQVERQFRRPIAYDVDYVYKGAKFRSRLPEDPGNRLRIRVAITPAVRGVATP